MSLDINEFRPSPESADYLDDLELLPPEPPLRPAPGTAVAAPNAPFVLAQPIDEELPQIPPPQGPTATPRQLAANLRAQVDAPFNALSVHHLMAALSDLEPLEPKVEATVRSAEDFWRRYDRIGTEGLTVMALDAQTNSALSAMRIARRAKRLAELQKHMYKRAEYKDTEDRIGGEKSSALNRVWGTLLGAGFSFAAGLAGQAMLVGSMTLGGYGQLVGQGLTAMGQMIGSTADAGMTAWDKRRGGQARADRASLRLITDQRMQEETQQLADAAQSWYDIENERFKKNLQATEAHNERMLQISSRIGQ